MFCPSVVEHIPRELWPASMRELQRLLKLDGILITTLDMETADANQLLESRLIEIFSLTLVGDPHDGVPLSVEEQRSRHSGPWHDHDRAGVEIVSQGRPMPPGPG